MAAGSDSEPGARRPTVRRALWVGLGLLAVLGAIGLRGGSTSEEAPADVVIAAAPVRAAPPLAPALAAETTSTPDPAAASAAPLAPIVDGIDLEKDEVCEGEENLVTVRAHTEGGREDGFLHAVVAGTPGMSVPLRATRPEPGAPARLVTVFGRDNVATTVALPEARVKDCTAARWLVVERRLRPSTDAELELRAQLVELEPGRHPAPDHWVWDFGDGATLETGGPYAVHDYGRRPQHALYSHFLVRVEAVSPDGERVVGRTTLALRNAAFTNLVYAGVVTLMVELEPRFPELDDRGVVRHRVRLWHHHAEPVRIRRVTVRRNYEGDRPPASAEVAVASLLGTSVIPPSGIVTRVSLDTRREPGVFSVDYALEGESAAGLPVRGAFSIMVPPPPPTPERSTPVEDPRERARIRKAMSVLGKPYVSEAELQTLEMQGAFDDVVVAPRPVIPPPPPRYGDMPPHPARRDEPPPAQVLPQAQDAPALTPEAMQP